MRIEENRFSAFWLRSSVENRRERKYAPALSGLSTEQLWQGGWGNVERRGLGVLPWLPTVSTVPGEPALLWGTVSHRENNVLTNLQTFLPKQLSRLRREKRSSMGTQHQLTSEKPCQFGFLYQR